jgi:hypothetical protein
LRFEKRDLNYSRPILAFYSPDSIRADLRGIKFLGYIRVCPKAIGIKIAHAPAAKIEILKLSGEVKIWRFVLFVGLNTATNVKT